MRCHFLLPPKHASKFHSAVDRHCAAELQVRRMSPSECKAALYTPWLDQTPSVFLPPQAAYLDSLFPKETSFLTDEELEVIDWAQTQPFTYRQRFQGQEQAKLSYRKATALEAVVRGYYNLMYTL